MDKGTLALLHGDLIEWVDSLPDVDERYEYRALPVPGVELPPGLDNLPTVSVRFGLVDILVQPTGIVGGGDGDMFPVYEIQAHSHPDEGTATECFRRNRERNERERQEYDVNPERAVARREARDMGMPEDLVNRLIPLTGAGLVDEIMGEMGRQRPGNGAPFPSRRTPPVESPVSGGPVGWEGPTGFYM
jgi:hypothetical protein